VIVTALQENINTATGDKLESTSVAPSQAFEVFAGKAYPTSSAGFSDAMSVSARSSELEIVGTSTSGSAATETPLQKLLRLQHEAKELAIEVGAAKGDSEAADKFPANLAGELSALCKQLEELSAPTAAASAFDPDATASQALRVQADLTSRMQKASTMDSSLSTQDGTGATYELFVTPQAPAEAAAATLKNAELEQRLAVVESALGMEAAEGSAAGSIADKLERLEGKVNLIDASMLETVGRKVKS